MTWIVQADYVLGGWQRHSTDLTELGRDVAAGIEVSPVARVTVKAVLNTPSAEPVSGEGTGRPETSWALFLRHVTVCLHCQVRQDRLCLTGTKLMEAVESERLSSSPGEGTGTRYDTEEMIRCAAVDATLVEARKLRPFDIDIMSEQQGEVCFTPKQLDALLKRDRAKDAQLVELQSGLEMWHGKFLAMCEQMLTESDALADLRRQGEWQPIATAPKDGASVLMRFKWKDGSDMAVGRWDAERGSWSAGFATSYLPEVAIDWRPLPDPPKETL